MSSPSSGRDPVEKLAEEFAERYRRGERPSLAEYTARYPELAAEIRELFPALVEMEQLASVEGPHTGPYASPASGNGAPPQQLGEYRILREIGHGGMGVVYEAVQESLGRHVALKVLPLHGLLNSTQRERFRREARAAAKLHHTNIVPVFGVGEDNGIHFYAMQFIRGQGLDAVLDEVRRLRGSPGTPLPAGPAPGRELSECVARGLLTGQFPRPELAAAEAPAAATATTVVAAPACPHVSPAQAQTGDGSTLTEAASGSPLTNQTESQYSRSVAQVGVQVAEALAYAHQQGILHRDIKPSNLLLDTAGTVWVTDFGLAKADDSDDLTNTGDLVGTLRFMAPERLDGRCDVRSEVYGVGVTLYEMATLCPAITAPDRLALLEQVRCGVVPRPSRFDPHVPRDLETIILKAMARDPAERYHTAEALAQDLRRFLADRPILARRTPWHERAWRWCRRNPVVATLSAAVLLLLTVTAIGASVGMVRLNTLLGRAQAAESNLTQKLAQLQRAERATQVELFNTLVEKARGLRRSQRLGQRFDSLDTIRRAVRLGHELHLPPEQFHRLRNEAVGSLALMDLKAVRSWTSPLGIMVAFDPDLKRYAGIDGEGMVSVRRVTDDFELMRFPGFPKMNRAWFQFSPDGCHLSAQEEVPLGNFGRIKVWRLGQNSAKLVHEVTSQRPGRPAFTPDSRSFAYVLRNGMVEVIDLKSHRSRRLPPVHGARGVGNLALHPDGRRFALTTQTEQGSVVQIRDFESGRVLSTVTGARTNFGGPLWHPAGRLLAVTEQHHVRLWDTAENTWTADLFVTANRGIEMAFNPSGDLLATADWNSEVHIWDPYSGSLLFKAQTTLAIPQFSRNGRFLSGGAWVANLAVWEVPQRCYRRLRTQPAGTNDWYGVPIVSPDGRLLAAAAHGRVCLWDLRSGQQVATLRRVGRGHTLSLAFDDEGALWIFGDSGLLRWPIKPAEAAVGSAGPPRRFPMDSRADRDKMSIDRAGHILVMSTVTGQWALHVGPPMRRESIGRTNDNSPQVSPDGRWIALADSAAQKVRILDAQSGQVIRDLPHKNCSHTIGFSPDGRWVAAGEAGGNYFQTWRTDTWKRGRRIEGTAPAFAPDSRMLAIEVGDGRLRLLDPGSEREFAELEDPHQDIASGMTFSRDGTRLITTSARADQALHVWDLRLLRKQLAELGLDWKQKTYPSAQPQRRQPLPRFEVDHGNLPLDPKDGLILYSLAIALQPLNPVAYLERAFANARLGHHGEALRDCDRALALHPGHAHAWYLRGWLHERALNQPGQALADYGRAIQHGPNVTLYRNARVRLALQRGERQFLREDCEKLVQLKAATATVLNNLAWELAVGPKEQRDPARALKLARQAVAEAPHDPTFLNTLGVAQYRSGQYPEARHTLEKSLAVGKGRSDGFDLFFLAMCHHHLGDAARARACYDRAVKWWQGQKDLSAQHTAELKAFQTEAEVLLRRAKP